MSEFLKQKPIILASGSAIRKKLLQSLGLEFQTIPSNCDEEEIKQTFQSEDWLNLGYQLAAEKALEVSRQHPEHFVISADQLCIEGKTLYDKPLSHEKALQNLKNLRGKIHQQVACLCLAKNGEILWQHHETAILEMRDLPDTTIETYLKTEKPYHSCGAYQYETLGKWLFKRVTGNEDTILGLPLKSLSEALIAFDVLELSR